MNYSARAIIWSTSKTTLLRRECGHEILLQDFMCSCQDIALAYSYFVTMTCTTIKITVNQFMPFLVIVPQQTGEGGSSASEVHPGAVQIQKHLIWSGGHTPVWMKNDVVTNVSLRQNVCRDSHNIYHTCLVNQ